MPIAKYHEYKCGIRKRKIAPGEDHTILGMQRELNKRLSRAQNDLVSQITRDNEEEAPHIILKNLVGVLESANGSNVITPSGKVDLTIRAQRLKDTKAELAELANKYGFTIRKVGSGVDSRLTIISDQETIYDTGPRGTKRIIPDYTSFGSPQTLTREDRPY